ncbi:MAG: cytochrome c biogenesis protein ResB [Desulfitobacteriaceae bacterium]|nr:cytochrome c biogenesis protein ResB [Desulfitobacteriaceae bacterium]MDI6915004.1 cytochrome c biogenesis protein ResB [Desulfitobacteriaceae bacterium]
MNENPKSWTDKLWYLFSSMKMGLALLGATALTSGIGTILPQTELEPDRAEAVSRIWQVLGFTHVYSTAWFRLLLGLLCVNLLVCSMQRFSGTYNRTFKPRPPQNSNDIPQKLRQEIKGSTENLRLKTEKILRDRGFRLIGEESGESWSFVAQKHHLGYWSAFIVHIAFVILISGAILGMFFGFKGTMMAAAGTTTALKNIDLSKGTVTQDFGVKVNSAEDRFLPNGERDNWYTNLSIIENGRETASGTLSVNHPFTYKGVTFYQASFDHGVHLTADVTGQTMPIYLRNQGRPFRFPNTDLYLFIGGMMGSPQQPVILFQIYKAGNSQPIQSGQLSAGESTNVQGQYKVTMEGYAGFTGLQVKKDPGVTVVWLGSGLLLLGLMLSFYWRPLLVSGILEQEGRLTLGMASGKIIGQTETEFGKLLSEIEGTYSKERAGLTTDLELKERVL